MTARSTSVGALMLRAMMSQLAVVLLSPPFKSCGWDLTAVPPRQLPAAQELVGARNLVHSMVKASHVGPAAVELCHESRGVFTNSEVVGVVATRMIMVAVWSCLRCQVRYFSFKSFLCSPQLCSAQREPAISNFLSLRNEPPT